MKINEFKKMTIEEKQLKMAQAIRFKMKGCIEDTQLDKILDAVSTSKQYTVKVAETFEEFVNFTKQNVSDTTQVVYTDIVYGNKEDKKADAAAIVERVKPSLKYGDYVENFIVLYKGEVA